jgi:hypothetical protein
VFVVPFGLEVDDLVAAVVAVVEQACFVVADGVADDVAVVVVVAAAVAVVLADVADIFRVDALAVVVVVVVVVVELLALAVRDDDDIDVVLESVSCMIRCCNSSICA